MSIPGRTRVLVVEDDPTVREVVDRYLTRDGHEVETVGNGLAAVARAEAEPPDLVVLDLMLPGLDGFEVCRRLRRSWPVPMIMLTARGEVDERIAGLETGADDYVTKPFSPNELVARVRAVLRRNAESGERASSHAARRALEAGGLWLDPAGRTATRDGEPLHLTVLEFDLLAYLMRHPGVAFGRQELLEAVWGSAWGDPSTVTVHVRRLREKLELDPSTPQHVVTVWGVGYRFEL